MKQYDAQAVKYITIFLTFLLLLSTLFFLYYAVSETFALILGSTLLVVCIFTISRRDTLNTVKTALELSNENNRSMAEVEKYRQQAQIAQFKAFQEVLRGDSKVREIEKKQEVKVLPPPSGIEIDQRLLTVNQNFMLPVEEAEFKVIEDAR
jgi:uncharacterized protein (DUF58 family)